MNLFVFLDTSLYWLIAAAGAGLITMILLLVVVGAPKWGGITGLFRRIVTRVPTLRGRLLIGLFLIGAIPVMTLPPILMLENARAKQHNLGDQLRLDASNVSHGLERLVRKQIAGVDALAAHLNAREQFDRPALEDWLLRHHSAHPELVSTWVARPDGEVVAATAFLEGDYKPWTGPLAGMSLMKFFPASVASGGLYVSPVIKGSAPRHDPMIVISAPILAEGPAPWGFIQAQLNLRRVYRNVVSYESISGRFLFLTDEKNRIIAAFPEIGFKMFDNLSGHAVVTEMAASNGDPYGFKGVLETDRPAGYFLAVQRALDSGWQVFAVASLAGTYTQALIYLVLALLWVFLVGYLAVSLAGFYGAIVGEPLQTLDRSLDIFDAEQTLKMVPIAPQDAPVEIVNVFNRVRLSLEKSRDSYRNMLRAVSESEVLRRKLQTDRQRQGPSALVPGVVNPKPEQAAVAAGKKKARGEKTQPEYAGRWDSVTALAGREVFKEYFGEAWTLGCVDSRPLSLVLFSIGLAKARAKTKDGRIDDAVFKSTGSALMRMAGRELDFVCRLDEDRYVLVLPDTDLYGALVVAERAREALHAALKTIPDGKALEANAAVTSVMPTPTGDAPSIVKEIQRLLRTAENKKGSRLAYVDEERKIKVLDDGESPPAAPPKAEKPEADDVAGSHSSPSDVAVALEETQVTAAARQPVDGDAANDDEDTMYGTWTSENDTGIIDQET